MAVKHVVVLNEGTPQVLVPGVGDTYELIRDTRIDGNLGGVNGDMVIKLGDIAGVNKLSILDSADVQQFAVTSDGNFGGIILRTSQANGNYAIGLSALASPSGLRNIGIGESAGAGIPSYGDDNVMIGHLAGSGGTPLSDNVVIGSEAGKNIYGGSNVIIGYNAASSAAFGGDNSVIIGYIAGDALNSGANDNNVMVGSGSGTASVTGKYNTFIGAFSASASLNADKSIAIGYSAQLASGDDYQISVGINTGVKSIEGYSGADADVDMSAKSMTITGASAYPFASTNQDGGDLILRGGQKANGGGTSGNVTIDTVDLTVKLGDTAGLNKLSITDSTDVEQFAVDSVGDFTGIMLRTDQANGTYALGLRALDAHTPGQSVRTVAIGTDAGTDITIADDVVCIGDQAGKNISQGSGNTCIGSYAGVGLTSKGNNTAIGHRTLTSSNVVSTTAIGKEAGETSSSDNSVFIGDRAGSFSTGNNATCVGWLAGYINTVADTVAVGYRAGYDPDGADGTFIGFEAGGLTSSGKDVVFVGSQAGYNTTGADNTFVGYRAGYNATTTIGSIALGDSVNLLSNTDSHQLVIGDAIVGYMSALTDVDYSGNNLTITGPSALAGAATNLDGGDAIFKGGDAATTGIGVGGQCKIQGGAKGSTGTEGGVEIGTAATSLIGLFGATPVVQPSGTGETTGFTAGSGTAANDDSTFTGNIGSTAYRINDIVKALKQLGVLAE